MSLEGNFDDEIKWDFSIRRVEFKALYLGNGKEKLMTLSDFEQSKVISYGYNHQLM